jgi:transposase-like protein
MASLMTNIWFGAPDGLSSGTLEGRKIKVTLAGLERRGSPSRVLSLRQTCMTWVSAKGSGRAHAGHDRSCTGTWHLDEVVVSIQGRRMYLWRAVNSEGETLDILVQRRRDKAAALKLMRELLRSRALPQLLW